MKIIKLANKVRSAIDKAKDQGEFIDDHRFKNFLTACCGVTTDLLAKFLFDNEITIQLNYVCGTYYDTELELPNHAWLEFGNNYIIDITGDQFKHYPRPLRFDIPVYVGPYSDFHKSFEIDWKENYSVRYQLDQTKGHHYLSRSELYEIILRHI